VCDIFKDILLFSTPPEEFFLGLTNGCINLDVDFLNSWLYEDLGNRLFLDNGPLYTTG
jgi:hypothetical protein